MILYPRDECDMMVYHLLFDLFGLVLGSNQPAVCI
jgi:hypothetical protein